MTRKTIENIPTNEADTVIRTSVSYQKGGMNLASYKNEPRGYWLSATPIKTENGFESFMLFSGVKLFLKEAARYSAKTFAEVCLAAKDNPRYSEVVASVAQSDGLELVAGQE